jgi:hypothetical protein
VLSLLPKDLKTEIDNAVAWLKPNHAKRDEMIKRYAGAHYRSDIEVPRADHSPENYPYAYHEFVKPQVLHGLPRCTARPVRSPEDMQTAEGLELAGNHWALETGAKEVFDEASSDAFFGWGVTKVAIDSRGDYNAGGQTAVAGDFENVPNFPYCVRIDPHYFIVDPEAKSFSKARFIGHCFERDLDDVQSDPRYPAELTSQLTESDRDYLPSGIVPGVPNNDRSGLRKRLWLWELWIREHGKILTLCDGGGTEGVTIIREETYFGPDEGPYTVWKLNRVPGELIPISSILALWDQFIELNTHRLDASDSAKTHKRIAVYDKANEDDADTIEKAANGALVGVTNANGIKDFELGGCSEYQLKTVEWLRDSYDRNLGFTDAQRGLATDTTATAADIANSSSNVRIAGQQDRIKDSVTDVFRKVLWYFFNDPTISPLELTYRDPMTGMEHPATFYPGPTNGGLWHDSTFIDTGPELDYLDFRIEVDGESMGKKDDAIDQKRAQDELSLTFDLSNVIGPQMINWRRAIDRYGNAFGVRELSSIILIDPSLLPDPWAMQPVQAAAGGGGGQMMPAQASLAQPGMMQQPMGAQPGAQPQRRFGGGSARGAASMPGLMNNAMAGIRPQQA